MLTDAAIMKKLIDSADKREAQRLNRLDSAHANAWLSARPSSIDGKDTILPPKIFRTAVARLLGQPVYSHSAPCLSPATGSQDTIACGTSSSNSPILASFPPKWRSWVCWARLIPPSTTRRCLNQELEPPSRSCHRCGCNPPSGRFPPQRN